MSRASRSPLVIVVTGPDGSGKSTLCARLREELGSAASPNKVAQVSVWDAMAASGLFADRRAVGAYLDDLDGPPRTLFIFHALSRSIDLALRGGAEVLVVEGYWYKYAVTEIAYGVEERFVEAAASAFPRPALTIRLDVGVEESWDRKGEATAYERGAAGRKSPPAPDARSDYIGFQRGLRPIWDSVERRCGPWERIPAGTAPAEALSLALGLCRRALGEAK